MKKLLLAALGTLALTSIASATPVSFTTGTTPLSCNGNLNCAPLAANQPSLIFSNSGITLTITYAGNTENSLNATPQATTNFGTLSLALSCGACTGLNASFDLTNATLQQSVSQTLPLNAPSSVNLFGVGQFYGSLNITTDGTGTHFGGVAGVLFPTTSGQIITVNGLTTSTTTYTLSQVPGDGYTVSLGNNTTFQGKVAESDVVASATPEPGTMLLMSSALVGLGLLKRKRA